MGRDDKCKDDFDMDNLNNEIIGDEVKRVFKKHPHDYISKLEELGFEFYDGGTLKGKKRPLPNPKVQIKISGLFKPDYHQASACFKMAVASVTCLLQPEQAALSFFSVQIVG